MKFDAAALQRLEGLLAVRPAAALIREDLRRASVLLLLVPSGENAVRDEYSIVFVQRSQNMQVHRGQIALPGGSVEAGESLEFAALRETEEEVGVPAHEVRLFGRLDDLVTYTGFIVAPFVGVLLKPVAYRLDAHEVAAVHEVPVAFFVDPQNVSVRFVKYQGGLYPSYSYRHGEIEVWGLTGRIVKSLIDQIYQAL